MHCRLLFSPAAPGFRAPVLRPVARAAGGAGERIGPALSAVHWTSGQGPPEQEHLDQRVELRLHDAEAHRCTRSPAGHIPGECCSAQGIAAAGQRHDPGKAGVRVVVVVWQGSAIGLRQVTKCYNLQPEDFSFLIRQVEWCRSC